MDIVEQYGRVAMDDETEKTREGQKRKFEQLHGHSKCCFGEYGNSTMHFRHAMLHLCPEDNAHTASTRAWEKHMVMQRVCPEDNLDAHLNVMQKKR